MVFPIELSKNDPAVAAIKPTAPKRFRLESVDVVRGIIMILMALDHTRDFLAEPSSARPTSPRQPSRYFSRAGPRTFVRRFSSY